MVVAKVITQSEELRWGGQDGLQSVLLVSLGDSQAFKNVLSAEMSSAWAGMDRLGTVRESCRPSMIP